MDLLSSSETATKHASATAFPEHTLNRSHYTSDSLLLRGTRLTQSASDSKRASAGDSIAIALCEAIRHAIVELEALVHPGLRGYVRHNHSTTASLLCPLCLASACGRQRLVQTVAGISGADRPHLLLAGRHCLANPLSGDASILSTLCRLSSVRAAEVAPGVQPAKLDRFVADFMFLFNALEDLVLGGAFVLVACDSIVDEESLLAALLLLIDGATVDDEHRSAAILMIMNLPLLHDEANGTLVHFAVQHKLHRVLRWLLEEVHAAVLRRRQQPHMSKSRLASLRCDSLNRRNRHGATPLSLAILLHDHEAARLLMLHGASAHAKAAESDASVAMLEPIELVTRSQCSLDMLRLFYSPTALATMHDDGVVGGGSVNVTVSSGSGEPRGALVSSMTRLLPAFEAADSSLQSTMQNCMSRSAAGALLAQVAQQLYAGLSQRAQLERSPRHVAPDAMDTLIRTLCAAHQADPWNAHVLSLLDRTLAEGSRMLFSGGDQHNPSEQHAQAEWDAGRSALAELLEGHTSERHTVSRAAIATPKGATSTLLAAVSESPGIATAADATVTHVRVFCPLSVVSQLCSGGDPRASVGYPLWLRLSPLHGSVAASFVESEMTHGHGFVVGPTAAGCPIKASDLVSFQRRGHMFVASSCVRQGSVSVTVGEGTACEKSIVMRRVFSGCWSEEETADEINVDPTVWMLHDDTSGEKQTLWRSLCNNPPTLQRLHALRTQITSPSFWAAQIDVSSSDFDLGPLAPALLPATSVVCTPIYDCCALDDPKLHPWMSTAVKAVVCSKNNTLLGLFPRI